MQMSRKFTRHFFICALTLFGLGLAIGCGGSSEPAQAPTTTQKEAVKSVSLAKHGTIVVRGFGDIRIEFLTDVAPKTVANFQKLARDNFYNGTTFHRVIPGFMIQGGDPNSRDDDPMNDGTGGPGYHIQAEFSDVPHARGILSMARAADPNSAGSQFFIVTHDSPHLNGQYTAFAKVISGMEVVDRISEVPTDQQGNYGPPNRPLENVVIANIRIGDDPPQAVPEATPSEN